MIRTHYPRYPVPTVRRKAAQLHHRSHAQVAVRGLVELLKDAHQVNKALTALNNDLQLQIARQKP